MTRESREMKGGRVLRHLGGSSRIPTGNAPDGATAILRPPELAGTEARRYATIYFEGTA